MNGRLNGNRNGNARAARAQERRITTLLANIIPQVMQAAQPAPPVVVPNTNNGYKSFISCNPPKFSGKEGATDLLQWFESLETTFSISNTQVENRVKFAASLFTKRALTWWNQIKIQLLATQDADSMTWAQFKERLTAEFCPKNEIKKLEAEFWELKQVGGNNEEYNTRFHELSLLVPHMVTPPSKAVDRYIDGLPLKVQTNVISNAPTTVEKAIQVAASLTDALVKGGKLIRTGAGKKPEKKVEKTEDKKTKSDEEAETSSVEKPAKKKQKFNQSKNFAITEPAKQNPPVVNRNPIPQNQFPQNQNVMNQRKNYTGPYPLCATCNYHHAAHLACYLCTNCNRYGHLANVCRIQNITQPRVNQPHQPYRQNFQQPANAAIMPRNGCFDCGNPGHFARDCPNRGARPQQAQIQAPANQGAPNA